MTNGRDSRNAFLRYCSISPETPRRELLWPQTRGVSNLASSTDLWVVFMADLQSCCPASRTQHLVKLKLQIPQPNRGNLTVGPPGKFVYGSVKSAHEVMACGQCGVSRMDPSSGPPSPDLIPSRRLWAASGEMHGRFTLQGVAAGLYLGEPQH